MKKKRWEIWRSQVSEWIKALHFSSLDINTKNSLKREMLFFNNSRFVVIAIVSMVMEAINIFNVLFLSRSGISSSNNRLYFFMYLILFGISVLCLLLRQILHKRPTLLQWSYVIFTLVWVLWHAALTAVDLHHNSDIIVFATGIMAMSFLVRIKPSQMLFIQIAGFSFLLCSAGKHLSNGNTINALIITVITMLIFCSRYLSMVDELGYRQKLVKQSSHIVDNRVRISLLLQQLEVLLTHIDSSVFVWDKSSDTLVFGDGRQLLKEDENVLLEWLDKKKKTGSMFLYMDSDTVLQEYEVKGVQQTDDNLTIIGAVGQICLKDYGGSIKAKEGN